MKKFLALTLCMIMTALPIMTSAQDNGLETAILTVKSRIDIPDTLTEFNQGRHTDQNGNTSYDLTWYSDTEGHRINVTITADGHIKSYNAYDGGSYYINEAPAFPKFQKDAIKNKALRFIQQISPDIAEELDVANANVSDGGIHNDGMSVNFPRIKNGLPVIGDYAYVGFERGTDKVQWYSCYWNTSSVFPEPSMAMNYLDAQNKFIENIGVELNYRSRYDENENSNAYLIYTPKKSTPIDAITGEAVVETSYGVYLRAEASAFTQDYAGGTAKAYLSPTERVEVDRAGTFISEERAVDIARGISELDITDDFTVTNINYSNRWNNKNDHIISISFQQYNAETPVIMDEEIPIDDEEAPVIEPAIDITPEPVINNTVEPADNNVTEPADNTTEPADGNAVEGSDNTTEANTPADDVILPDGLTVPISATEDAKIAAASSYIYPPIGPDGRYINVELDAVTGELNGFSAYRRFYDSRQESPDTVSPEVEKAVMDFFDKYFKSRFGDSVTEGEVNYNYGTYSVNFVRTENGIPFPDNSIGIAYNTTTGNFEYASVNWDKNMAFDDSSNIISLDDATTKLFANVGLRLSYMNQFDDMGNDNGVRLVYALDEMIPAIISAQNGDVLDWGGNAYVPINASVTLPSDVYGHYAQDEIQKLADFGVITFEKDELYKPDQEITQEEFFDIAMNIGENYYYKPLRDEMYSMLKARKLLTDEEIDPNAPITRIDAAKFILRIIGLKEVAEIEGIYKTGFKDEGAIPSALLGYAALGRGLKIFNGDAEGNFKPDANMSRADLAITIHNYLAR